MAEEMICIHCVYKGAEAPQATVDDSMPIPRKLSPTSVNIVIPAPNNYHFTIK